ncbi:MAG: hypothetical protein COW67_04475 [Flavobacteriales bacterium CG18_big_fil_WC_8_21_14_2_50_32_9]|nr:MAG: hypothetical protein COW67_04475 [Flavobacteriales bacterium CG18_big_fil_WC_8_21_14_2_50_32_9]
MTPFVVLLNKNELDELVTVLVNSNNEKNLNNEVYSIDELVSLVECLLKQNESLIEIVKKLKPLSLEKQKIIFS